MRVSRCSIVILVIMVLIWVAGAVGFAQTVYTYGFFHYTVSDSSVTIINYTGAAESVVVPNMIAGNPVNIIGNGSFHNTPAKIIYLPETVMAIEEGAFDDGQRVIYNHSVSIDSSDIDIIKADSDSQLSEDESLDDISTEMGSEPDNQTVSHHEEHTPSNEVSEGEDNSLLPESSCPTSGLENSNFQNASDQEVDFEDIISRDYSGGPKEQNQSSADPDVRWGEANDTLDDQASSSREKTDAETLWIVLLIIILLISLLLVCFFVTMMRRNRRERKDL